MRATAIVPVKRFGAAKSRLAGSIAGGIRPELAEAMLTDVLAALASAAALERVIVVSGEPAARKAAERLGAECLDDPADDGHSPAALRGIAAASEAGARCVALLPGDCPLVLAEEVDRALGGMTEGTVVVVPDRHGSGTNGLLLSPPEAIVPSFGPASRERHLGLARDAGKTAQVDEIPSLALDLDTADDLEALAARLRTEPELAPATAAALRLLNGQVAGGDGP